MQVEAEACPPGPEVAAAWRALEPACAALSFFQSWSWLGCLVDERFATPVLLRLMGQGGVPLALALFNRRGGRLVLADSGDPVLDAPFTEDSGPLLAGEAGPGALEALFAAAWALPGVRRLVLRGVPPAVAAAAGGIVLSRQERPAPYVDLAALRAAGRRHLDGISANTRQQIRRSMRSYEAAGPLVFTPAASLAEAEAVLAQPGGGFAAFLGESARVSAFASPFMRRFHAGLLRTAFPRGEIELARVAAGPRRLGCLYNFRHRQRVYAYQSGFDREGAGRHEKPGLTCHALAIAAAEARGDSAYDFLAGEDRYKRSLSNASRTLVWAELVRPLSPLGLLLRLRRARPELIPST